MEEQVEIVARALFDAENEWRDMAQGECGERLSDRNFKVAVTYWHMMARAAIEAMAKETR